MADSGGIVALLFTDIVGSTTMYDRLGDERAEALRRAHFASLRQAISAHGGREVKSLGDGLMVAFSSAVAAVDAAVAMQRAAVATAPSALDGPASELRVGLHASEPVRDEDDYFGMSVTIAAGSATSRPPARLWRPTSCGPSSRPGCGRSSTLWGCCR